MESIVSQARSRGLSQASDSSVAQPVLSPVRLCVQLTVSYVILFAESTLSERLFAQFTLSGRFFAGLRITEAKSPE